MPYTDVRVLYRFADALEGADDPDLRWRYYILSAASLALLDAGDAPGAAARAAAGFQHAEAYALREGEAAEKARGVLSEVRYGKHYGRLLVF